MKWRCPHCADLMDLKFRSFHEKACASLKTFEQRSVENFLRSIRSTA